MGYPNHPKVATVHRPTDEHLIMGIWNAPRKGSNVRFSGYARCAIFHPSWRRFSPSARPRQAPFFAPGQPRAAHPYHPWRWPQRGLLEHARDIGDCDRDPVLICQLEFGDLECTIKNSQECPIECYGAEYSKQLKPQKAPPGAAVAQSQDLRNSGPS